MATRQVTYREGNTELDGYLACESDNTPRPAVLILHAWGGAGDFERDKARKLAELGYAAFAVDMYGAGKRGTNPEENTRLMMPFLEDRKLLARRLDAALRTVQGLPEVDASRIAAIGYCFGGLCVLDLARMGADVRGVVSFHGLLTAPAGGERAKIRAKVLALHGQDDPLVPPEQVQGFIKEMSEAGADWQIHIYGDTVHAFTEPTLNDRANGVAYSPTADRRSWATMQDFLREVFA
ncbi:MAG: dienelactone hydrolase family protein [Candidatus Binatia bacterium]